MVVSGDYNIAHTAIDLARPDPERGQSGLPARRARLDEPRWAPGYIDTFRHLHPEPGNYTWWTYRVPAPA